MRDLRRRRSSRFTPTAAPTGAATDVDLNTDMRKRGSGRRSRPLLTLAYSVTQGHCTIRQPDCRRNRPGTALLRRVNSLTYSDSPYSRSRRQRAHESQPTAAQKVLPSPLPPWNRLSSLATVVSRNSLSGRSCSSSPTARLRAHFMEKIDRWFVRIRARVTHEAFRIHEQVCAANVR